jgi:CubicO group peptidase (beta-lactamase class C family)
MARMDRMRGIGRLVVAALALCAASASAQQRPPLEKHGFSVERLGRLHYVMQGHVDRGEVAGAVTLLVRDGEVVDVGVFGKGTRADTLFRLASMTKPIVTVAALMLLEEGRLALTDPVAKYVPAFKDLKVVGAGGALVPAERAISVHDLMTHRAGIIYPLLEHGAVAECYRKAGVVDGIAAGDVTLEVNAARIASCPLASQPGRAFHYGLSTDVLARVVEVASGMPLDRFLDERLFRPLHMDDTAFVVPEGKRGRLAPAYTVEGGKLRVIKEGEAIGGVTFTPDGAYRAPRRYLSGGAGLVSTAQDYGRFLLALAGGGQLDGVRLLGPKTVELMTQSHTRDLPRDAVDAGSEFGLGVAVVTDVAATAKPGSTGMWGWGGLYGTAFFVDPKERLVGVVMEQRWPREGIELGDELRVLSYQALVR